MIAADVFISIDLSRPLADNLFLADLDGAPALAFLPGGAQDTLRGHVVALLVLDGVRYPLCAPYGALVTEAQIRQILPGAAVEDCLYEKSCGAIVFYRKEDAVRYLLIENRCHNWGFPKGHVEPGETEFETAQREIFEETGLKSQIFDGFRRSVQYYVREGVHKTAVYFVAQVFDDKVCVPEGEISSFEILDYDKACARLTYASERELLKSAKAFIDAL